MQNDAPFPVITMARIAGSDSESLSALASCSSRSSFSAFPLSGRFSQIVCTGPVAVVANGLIHRSCFPLWLSALWGSERRIRLCPHGREGREGSWSSATSGQRCVANGPYSGRHEATWRGAIAGPIVSTLGNVQRSGLTARRPSKASGEDEHHQCPIGRPRAEYE